MDDVVFSTNYRGYVRNGVVVLDSPAALPEGAAVEVSLVGAVRPPITSIEQLRSKLPDDDFGDDFEETLRKWRQEPLVTHNRKHFEGIAGLTVISEG